VLFWVVQHSCPESRIRVCVDQEDRETLAAIQQGYKFGIRLDFSAIPNCRRFVVMANHQIYLDWVYVWCFLSRLDLAGWVRFVLKRELLFFPVIGLGMKLADFIFVSRNWEKDKIKLGQRVQRLAYNSHPFGLVIFPEGTVLTEETYSEMIKHVEEKDIKTENVPENCLIPRVNGLHAILNSLTSKNCDGVLDLTVGFQGVNFSRDPGKSYGIKQLLFHGVAPDAIHIHVKFFPIHQIPYSDRNELSSWLKSRFLEKDKLLGDFVKNKKFANSKYQWGETKVYENSFLNQIANSSVALFILYASFHLFRLLFRLFV
jgi:lysocardiolipin and lysophospholipid acyltransferase